MTRTEHHRLPDGRCVGVHTLARGADEARTVVFCHPAPGSGNLDPDPGETTRHGVNLVAVERAGYGASDPVVYGALDPVAGPAHAAWWERSLPDARVEVVADAGHLLIVPTWRLVLAHLAPPPSRGAVADVTARSPHDEFTVGLLGS